MNSLYTRIRYLSIVLMLVVQTIQAQTYLPLTKVLRLAWTDSTINYNPYDDQRPLAIQGVVFPYNNTEYAINMSDGTKMFYKNSRVFFERLFGDSLLLFDTKKRAVVVNIFSGNIVLDIEKQYGAYNGYLVPNFVKGAVYVKTDKKELTSYETESGKIKWRFTTANAIYTLSLWS